jgi:hypothetical protein
MTQAPITICPGCEDSSLAHNYAAEVCDRPAPPMLERVTHEYPGYTILSLRDFDIGLDDWCEEHPVCNGVRLFVYAGRHADEVDCQHGSITMHGWGDEDGRGPLEYEPNDRIGSPLLHTIESDAESVHVVLNNGTALQVREGHVYVYGCDDGMDCRHIVHTLPADRVRCEQFGGCEDVQLHTF